MRDTIFEYQNIDYSPHQSLNEAIELTEKLLGELNYFIPCMYAFPESAHKSIAKALESAVNTRDCLIKAQEISDE